jgi:hypothetical protein
MLFSGNTVLAEPGMVFFLHCMVADSENGLALSLGCICLVTGRRRGALRAPVGVDRGLAAFPCGKQTVRRGAV